MRPSAISHGGHLSGAAVLLWRRAPAAHDIPNDVTVQTFLKPEGQRLRLLVRVPLTAMRDMDYPKPRGTTNARSARSGARRRDAARRGDALDVRLPRPLRKRRASCPRRRSSSVRASLQSDKSFASYDEAIAHLTGPPLPDQTEFFWSQGLLDVLFEYPIQSDQSRFSIQPRLARLGIRTLTVLRFLPPGGAVRGFEFYGDPGLVRLDPRWHQAALQFVKLGFFHILDGTDHLLFLVCLVIPFRRLRSLVAVVTAFTVAHSITLIASAYNLAPDALWFPPLIETLIAASIVYMALENIVFAGRETAELAKRASMDAGLLSGFAVSALKRRWLVTFAFGLVHGFGFSFALRQTLQFAGSHLLTSLLSFNVGVELGQLLVLVAADSGARCCCSATSSPSGSGTIILSALVAHTAWHWMSERWERAAPVPFEWPAIDAAFLAGAMRWMMLVVVAAALYWLVFGCAAAVAQV